EMKPLGRKTNLLICTSRAPALREKITCKKRLTDRAHTFRESGLDVQKNMRRPAAFFYLTSPFIGQCYTALPYLVDFEVSLYEPISALALLGAARSYLLQGNHQKVEYHAKTSSR